MKLFLRNCIMKVIKLIETKIVKHHWCFGLKNVNMKIYLRTYITRVVKSTKTMMVGLHWCSGLEIVDIKPEIIATKDGIGDPLEPSKIVIGFKPLRGRFDVSIFPRSYTTTDGKQTKTNMVKRHWCFGLNIIVVKIFLRNCFTTDGKPTKTRMVEYH